MEGQGERENEETEQHRKAALLVTAMGATTLIQFLPNHYQILTPGSFYSQIISSSS